MMPKSRSYQADLFKALRDTEEAQEYLNTALKDVIDANQYQGKNQSDVLSLQASSELNNPRHILSRLGYRLMIEKFSA